MSNLSTQPYKGAKDYYPEDQRLLNYIFSVWRKQSRSFGYQEYGAPLLEPLELFAAKSGQEIVNEQTYTFVDRGGRQVVIRPEMTPSVSRMVAARRQELAYPLRLYSIANFMRYERPQRGREREFWQLNADIFGVASVDAEAEIITLADRIMKSFGAAEKSYKIKINSRQLVNVMMAEYLNLDVVQSELMVKLFDRKDKISREEFRDQAAAIFDTERSGEGLKKIARLLGAKTMGELPPQLLKTAAVAEVQALFTLLRERGVGSAVFDITLMRGFDYYSGIVFELFDTDPENSRALFGGGRYDGLVGLFGVENLPVVGMAPGATTLKDFLTVHGLLPDLPGETDVYAIVTGAEAMTGAQALVDKLRQEGVNVALDITGRKVDKQIKSAVKSRVPFMLFLGQQELADETYTLKDVLKESEQKLSFERLVTTVKDYRRRGRSETEEEL